VISWAIYALMVLVGPLVLVARWLLADVRRGRTRARFLARQGTDYSVGGITARVERERADSAVVWPEADPDDTVVLPVVMPANEPDGTEALPDNVLPFVPRLPVRKRRYVDQASPPAVNLSFELLQRLRDGLDRL
jgi:hypothetical protein